MRPKFHEKSHSNKFPCRRSKKGPSWVCLPARNRAVRTDLDLRLRPTILLFMLAPLKCEEAPKHRFIFESFFTHFKAWRMCIVCFCRAYLNKYDVI